MKFFINNKEMNINRLQELDIPVKSVKITGDFIHPASLVVIAFQMYLSKEKLDVKEIIMLSLLERYLNMVKENEFSFKG